MQIRVVSQESNLCEQVFISGHKMSFLSFFLKLELHNTFFKISTLCVTADETTKGHVIEMLIEEELDCTIQECGGVWVNGEEGDLLLSILLLMTEKTPTLPNSVEEHCCFLADPFA